MIAAARLISKLAHKGQVDKAGIDYFTHPEAVAAMLDTPQEKVVGYLHDTVEDTDVATGVRNGAKGFLVLTGEATMKTVEESDVEPTCIYESLDEMRKYL